MACCTSNAAIGARFTPIKVIVALEVQRGSQTVDLLLPAGDTNDPLRLSSFGRRYLTPCSSNHQTGRSYHHDE